MNSSETVVYTNPAVLPGQLAPITRIGAGELRVEPRDCANRNCVETERRSQRHCLLERSKLSRTWWWTHAEGRELRQTPRRYLHHYASFRYPTDEASEP